MLLKEKMKPVINRIAVVVPAVVSCSALCAVPAFAADASASASATEAVGLVTAVSSLFTTYPMNVFLGCGLAAAGLGLFARAKRTSGGKS